jgi:heptosyltransferase-3
VKKVDLRDARGIRRILVIKLRHIGDVLLTVPVFRALREHFPNAHISALVNAGTEEVLTGNPLIDEVITFDRNIKSRNFASRISRELSFLGKLRKEHFDMAVDLTSGDRAAIISLVSGAKYRLAYDPGKKGFPGKRHLYTHRAFRGSGRGKHMVLQNLEVVKQFGIWTDNLTVDFYIPEEARLFVEKIFEEHAIREDESVVHVHPTSRWFFKCWKDEYMAEVIGWLIEQGTRVIVTASPDRREVEKTGRILSLAGLRSAIHTPQLVDLCGKTTIKQLGAISRASDLFFGVDSAPMHVAAAVGTPVLALFGPTGDFNWRPWYGKGDKDPHVVARRERGCRKCVASRCEYGVCRYLTEITPDEIKDVLKQMLSE